MTQHDTTLRDGEALATCVWGPDQHPARRTEKSEKLRKARNLQPKNGGNDAGNATGMPHDSLKHIETY